MVARYIDWWFSTPAMLFILLALAFFQDPCARSADVANEYGGPSILILLDWAMLLVGVLAEGRYYLKREAKPFAAGCSAASAGFRWRASSILYFWLLAENLYSDEGLALLLITLAIWTLYGVVAVWLVYPFECYRDKAFDQRSQLKNAWYNILDLFSKNAMGIIITVVAFSRYADDQDAGNDGGDAACNLNAHSPPPPPPPLFRGARATRAADGVPVECASGLSRRERGGEFPKRNAAKKLSTLTYAAS